MRVPAILALTRQLPRQERRLRLHAPSKQLGMSRRAGLYQMRVVANAPWVVRMLSRS